MLTRQRAFPTRLVFRQVTSQSTMRRVLRLAEMADKNPADPHAQYAFVKELNMVKPEAVLKRLRTQHYAVNADVVQEHIKALRMTNQTHTREYQDLVSQGNNHYNDPNATPNDSTTKQSSSDDSSQEPLELQLPKPTIREELWHTFRTLGLAFLVIGGMTYVFDALQPGQGKLGLMDQDYSPTVSSEKRFSDVKGCAEAVSELEEVVMYLKDASVFTRLGGKLPKGVLLTGPPGTGKTLLARAVAGEAGVPFFYVSGSEFDEVYVGVGARRMRNLFAAAREHAPCIVFVDEIDAVGGKRNPRDSHSSKMTLNQMLVEMDGFEDNNGVVVVGATNFPGLLDEALTRPGRFDRHVTVHRPDVRGRSDILNLYLKNIPTAVGDKDKMVNTIARGTPGFTGAELENLINVGSIRATQRNADIVELQDLEYAREKILMGPEKKTFRTTKQARECTAHHEAGHALVAALTKGADPIYKATILPRGQALGMVQQLPKDDQYSVSREMMLARLDVMMAGRIAEELLLGSDDYTSGASSDLDQASSLARAMVMKWGLSERVGPVYYDPDEEKDKMSPDTRRTIDEEAEKLLQEAHARAKAMILNRRREHAELVAALLEKETLEGEEIRAIALGQRRQKPAPKTEKTQHRQHQTAWV